MEKNMLKAFDRYYKPSEKFEQIEGLTNRELTEDQYELVNTIKSGQEGSLYKKFQEYWMVRCANHNYLTDYDSFRVLSGYAKDMFDHSDWFCFNECINRTFFHGESLSAKDMVEAYLTAIVLMQMRYKERN
jgi:hypothetical protein